MHRERNCLSLETPQPFGRSSLCRWRWWKHRCGEAFLWVSSRPSHSYTTRLYSKSHCRKTARWNCKIFCQRIDNNIPLHDNPRSHLDEAVCAAGVRGNIHVRKDSCRIIARHHIRAHCFIQSHCWKTARYNWKIHCQYRDCRDVCAHQLLQSFEEMQVLFQWMC